MTLVYLVPGSIILFIVYLEIFFFLRNWIKELL